jgi:hypothetical protein
MKLNIFLLFPITLIISALLIVFPYQSFAQVPPPPIVLDVGPGSCTPSTVICGDGIDQTCDGRDELCEGVDKDRDGFADNLDCDDSDRYIYPGISTTCNADCGKGTRTCLSNGNYSPCSCTPLCEASGSGRCYYISSESGSDSNPGTFNAPWKTYLNIVSYYYSHHQRPSGWVSLKPGDVVYFMSGMYRNNYDYNGARKALFIRDISGTSNNPITLKAYPGQRPVIWPLVRQAGINLQGSSHFRIEGFEVTGAYGAGVLFAGGSNIELRNTWIHDIDGIDNDNIAGLYITGASNLDIHHNLIHDNYDRTNHDTGGIKTENSRNIVIFGGGNIRVNHNVIFQTPPITAAKTGGCITYKHSATIAGAVFEVDNNLFRNCAKASIGSGTYNTKIHRNLLIDSAPIEVRDFGGTTHNRDITIEYNTIVNGIGLNYHPSTTYGPVGLLTFRNNIVVDNSTSHHNEKAMVVIATYWNDAMYHQVVTNGNLAFSNNCYFNTYGTSSLMRWSLFAAKGGNYGELGGLYSFAQWKDLGFNYDVNSVVANPQLSSDYVPQNQACKNMGRDAF